MSAYKEIQMEIIKVNNVIHKIRNSIDGYENRTDRQ